MCPVYDIFISHFTSEVVLLGPAMLTLTGLTGLVVMSSQNTIHHTTGGWADARMGSIRPSPLDLSFSVIWVCPRNRLSCFLVEKLFLDYSRNRKRVLYRHEIKQAFKCY